MTGTSTGIDYTSDSWWAIKRYLKGRIDDLQLEIEGRLGQIETTEVRTMIRAFRELLALDVPEPEIQITTEEEEF